MCEFGCMSQINETILRDRKFTQSRDNETKLKLDTFQINIYEILNYHYCKYIFLT